MATDYPTGPVQSLVEELESLRRNWFWFLLFGVLLIILGCVSIGYSFIASEIYVLFFGVLLVIGGVANLLGSFQSHRWSGFLLHLLAGFFYVVVGVLIVENPFMATLALTLVVAVLLLVGGLFRIVSAVVLRFPNWGWVLVNGIITFLLGLLIWRQWPISGLWVIGLFVGIDLIFNGWSWVMLALAVRGGPRPTAPPPA